MVVSPMTMNLKGEEMPEEMPTIATLEGAEMVISPVPVRGLATTLELAPLVSPVTNLKGEEMPEEMPTFATLEGAEMVIPQVPARTLAATLELAYLVSPMTLRGEGDRHDEGQGDSEEVSTLAPLLEMMVFPVTLDLSVKNQEDQETSSYAAALEAASEATAYPTTTHRLQVYLMARDPPTQVGRNYSLKTSTRTAKADPAKMPSRPANRQEGEREEVPTLVPPLEMMAFPVILTLPVKGEESYAVVLEAASEATAYPTTTHSFPVDLTAPDPPTKGGHSYRPKTSTRMAKADPAETSSFPPANRREGEEAKVSALAPPLEMMIFPMTLVLPLAKSKEMSGHATTLEAASEATACPTATHRLQVDLTARDLPTEVGHNYSLKTSTRTAKADPAEIPSRPAKTDPAEIPSRLWVSAATATCPMLPPTRATSSASWLPHPLLRLSHRGVPWVFSALLLGQRGRG